MDGIKPEGDMVPIGVWIDPEFSANVSIDKIERLGKSIAGFDTFHDYEAYRSTDGGLRIRVAVAAVGRNTLRTAPELLVSLIQRHLRTNAFRQQIRTQQEFRQLMN